MEGFNQQHSGTDGPAVDVPMLVTAAHELKSPLALVRQLSLSLEAGDCTPEEIATLARQITLTTERALRLTTSLTKTARLDDSLFDLEPLNPMSVCDEVVRELTPLYRAKGRTIEVAPRTKPLLGLANRELLRRILVNFVDNALHYSGSDDPVIITASSRDSGQKIRVGVRDHGPAIPPKVWNKLGETIGTDAQSLHARPESSGLGIYISRQFAEAMQADVGALRHRDGATFYVDIGVSTQLRLL